MKDLRAWVSRIYDEFSHGGEGLRDQRVVRRRLERKENRRSPREADVSLACVSRESSTYAIRTGILKIRAYFSERERGMYTRVKTTR